MLLFLPHFPPSPSIITIDVLSESFFFFFLTEERPLYTADGLPARILEESSGVFIVQEYASIPKVTWKAVCILFILSVKCVQRETEVSTFLLYYFIFLKIVTSYLSPN